MDVIDQKITDEYAIYNGDCGEILPKMEPNKIHFSIYSPPFSDLYNYTSSSSDLSNCKDYNQFFEHYEYIVKEIYRVTMPGRLTAVHCMDVPLKGDKEFIDFPGDIIRLHEKIGFYYVGRRSIWKEPLRMAIRTRAKGLMHRQITKDSSLCNVAGADVLLTFRKNGKNEIPVEHPTGFKTYAGENQPPEKLKQQYKDWKDPKTNKLSHYIWQRYASSVWMDIRINHVLEYRAARDSEEEKHVCPLQLDVIERGVVLWTNRGETVLTPFMGVGSEVCGALLNDRKGIGIELKPSYYRQAIKNIKRIESEKSQRVLFD